MNQKVSSQFCILNARIQSQMDSLERNYNAIQKMVVTSGQRNMNAFYQNLKKAAEIKLSIEGVNELRKLVLIFQRESTSPNPTPQFTNAFNILRQIYLRFGGQSTPLISNIKALLSYFPKLTMSDPNIQIPRPIRQLLGSDEITDNDEANILIEALMIRKDLPRDYFNANLALKPEVLEILSQKLISKSSVSAGTQSNESSFQGGNYPSYVQYPSNYQTPNDNGNGNFQWKQGNTSVQNPPPSFQSNGNFPSNSKYPSSNHQDSQFTPSQIQSNFNSKPPDIAPPNYPDFFPQSPNHDSQEPPITPQLGSKKNSFQSNPRRNSSTPSNSSRNKIHQFPDQKFDNQPPSSGWGNGQPMFPTYPGFKD